MVGGVGAGLIVGPIAGGFGGLFVAVGLILLIELLPRPWRRGGLRSRALIGGATALLGLTVLTANVGTPAGPDATTTVPAETATASPTTDSVPDPSGAATTATVSPQHRQPRTGTVDTRPPTKPSSRKPPTHEPPTHEPPIHETSARPAASLRTGSHGVLLPDPHQTPGAVSASATRSRVCTPGYSSSVRHVTIATRHAVFAAYGIAWTRRSHYEVDHLIPLELGGSNTITNLWPEPDAGSGYPSKDRLENHLHALVCAGQVPLSTAQRAIATNWGRTYQRYITITVHQHRVSHPRPRTPAKPDAAGGGATAQCNDGTYSYAQHHQGACSHHRGVRQFYK